MENATDALKIAFAVFVFVIAITITFSFISQAKNTSDVVLYYADDTNFYDYADSSETNRTVSVAEVISTLYRYYKESTTVTIIIGNKIDTFDLTTSDVNMKEIQKKLSDYITNNLLSLNNNSKFKEEFIETTVSGIYTSGEDNTNLTLTSGGKKLYVTYTLQPT